MLRLYRALVRVMVNLKFSVILLSVIALVSIGATIIGALQGSDEAQMEIFRSAGFAGLMFVFTFALALSVASRWPWKKTQIGWIGLHVGLIVIVSGHLATCHYGREGRVDLAEGETASRMDQPHFVLTADIPSLGSRFSVRLPFEELPIDEPIAGKSWRLPGGDTLTVERYFPAFTMRRIVEADGTARFVALNRGDQASRPAVLVSLSNGVREWIAWNGQDRPTVLAGSQGPIELRYGAKQVPLGFSIRLDDFVLETYEGTENPMSFESHVTVIPHDGTPAYPFHIYMNNPLTHAGFTFFQSSYDPETLRRSIFQVSYDPGWPLVYLGYALTTLGLLFIVYVKPILIRRDAARLAAAGLARVRERDAKPRAPAGNAVEVLS
jgi:hypothetical protein